MIFARIILVLFIVVVGSGTNPTMELNGVAGTAGSPTEVGTIFGIANGTAFNDTLISLKSGQLNVGNPDTYTGATAISVSGGTTVNAIDGAISAYDNITLADGAQIKFDVNNQRPRLRGLLL